MNATPSNYTVNTSGYYVYRKEANGTWTKLTTSGAITNMYYNVSGLKPGVKYTYAVQARDEFSNLSQFTEITFRTPCSSSCPDTTDIDINVIDNSISVYPNPANDIISITSADDINEMNIRISDLCGKVWIEKTIFDRQVDISALSPGVYFIRVNSSVFKLIKN